MFHDGRNGQDGQEDDFMFNEYAMDDSLDPLTRVERYHTSDFALQRLVLIRDVADTAREAGIQETLTRLVPLLSAFVSDSEPSVRLVLVEQLYSVCEFIVQEGKEAGYAEFLNTLLPFAFELIVDKNVEVGGAALQTTIKLVSLVQPAHIEANVLNVIVSLARDERAEDYRVVAVQLFDELAHIFGPSRVENILYPEVSTLSEDMSFSVRRVVAVHLGKQMSVVGPDIAHERYFPIFQTLCSDEIWGVRKACAEALVSIAQGLDPSVRHTDVFELFVLFSEDVSRWVRVSACQQLGPLLHTMQPDKISHEMLKCFTDMAFQGENSNDSDYSEYCAHSFPGVVLTVGSSRWDEMAAAFQMLIKDVQWKVRKTMACSLHEIARIVGQDIAERILVPAFELFLRDLDEIKVSVIENCHHLIGVLGPAARERCIPLICAVPAESDNWRVRHVVAQRLGHIAALCSPSFCREHIADLAFRILDDSVADVRYSGFYAVGQVLQKLHGPGTDENPLTIPDFDCVLNNILELASRGNYNNRLMFLYIAQQVVENGDIHLFVTSLLEPLVALAQDSVANVRLVLARTLTASYLHDPELQKNDTIRNIQQTLMKDTDSDVTYFASLSTTKSTDPTRLAYYYRNI